MTHTHSDVTIEDLCSQDFVMRLEQEGFDTFINNSRPCIEVITKLGGKWSSLIVMLLGSGAKRFGEIRRLVTGISQRMLTVTLRDLERDGMVTRTSFATIPPRVDYELTPLGRSFRDQIVQLGDWAGTHFAEIEAAQRAYDAQKEM